jgi:hypothetical protein
MGNAAEFMDRLVVAGFPPTHFDRYTSRFSPVSIRLLEVAAEFPRLVPGSVAGAIRKVNYELDLDKVLGEGFDIEEVLERLGVA